MNRLSRLLSLLVLWEVLTDTSAIRADHVVALPIGPNDRVASAFVSDDGLAFVVLVDTAKGKSNIIRVFSNGKSDSRTLDVAIDEAYSLDDGFFVVFRATGVADPIAGVFSGSWSARTTTLDLPGSPRIDGQYVAVTPDASYWALAVPSQSSVDLAVGSGDFTKIRTRTRIDAPAGIEGQSSTHRSFDVQFVDVAGGYLVAVLAYGRIYLLDLDLKLIETLQVWQPVARLVTLPKGRNLGRLWAVGPDTAIAYQVPVELTFRERAVEVPRRVISLTLHDEYLPTLLDDVIVNRSTVPPTVKAGRERLRIVGVGKGTLVAMSPTGVRYIELPEGKRSKRLVLHDPRW